MYWGVDFICVGKKVTTKYNGASTCYLFAHVAFVHYAHK